MEQTLETIFASRWGLQTLATAITVAYAVALFTFFRRIAERREKERNRFFKVLAAALRRGSISSLGDVQNLYRGIRGTGAENGCGSATLSRWLREYLVQLLENGKEDENQFTEWKELISKLIEEHERQSPYASLPELEGSIITDIEMFLDADNKSSVRRKLTEITAAIQAREDSLARIKNTNRWLVPLAMVGMVLTLIFGISSLVQWTF